jgi:hypothetical protein
MHQDFSMFVDNNVLATRVRDWNNLLKDSGITT